jgi:hypothetical protein
VVFVAITPSILNLINKRAASLICCSFISGASLTNSGVFL